MAAASVFICHAQPDAAFAQDLAVALETCRLSVWRDTRNLRGDDRLALEVRWAIEQARQVIVVLGLNTGEAAWMRREIELAQEVERRQANTYRVIPLLLPGLDRSHARRLVHPDPANPTDSIDRRRPGRGAASAPGRPGRTTARRSRLRTQSAAAGGTGADLRPRRCVHPPARGDSPPA